jgi:sirohydrochlorin cobaltochelatase
LPVKPGDFSDAALVLFGHGTRLDPGSGAAVTQHANAMRRTGLFSEVREAFWKQEPRLLDVANVLSQRRVFFVPFFISEGYFCEQIIPAALGFPTKEGTLARERVLRKEARIWLYCRPVGTHERMAAVLLDRARSIVREFPFPSAPAPEATTLFIAGHGSQQNEDSRRAVEQKAEVIRAMNEFAAVHAIFLEEDPGIAACYRLAKTRNLVVVPFFIGDGPHVRQDIPLMLGGPEKLLRERLARGAPPWRNPTEMQGKLVWYTRSVGTDPLLSEVVLARVHEAADRAGYRGAFAP